MQTLQQIITSLTAIVMALSAQVSNLNQSINPNTQLAQVAPTSGLVAHYKFDEGSGTTASDSSGNNNTGTLVNGPAWTAGKVGSGALSFDGTNDYVTMGNINVIDGISAVTFSLWIKPSLPTDLKQIFGKWSSGGGNGLTLHTSYAYGSDDVLWGGWNGSNFLQTNGNILPNNVWTHIVGVFDGSQPDNANRLKLYANGIQATVAFNGVIPATTPNTAYDVRVSADSEGSRAFSGTIDEVRIYNRALSASEIMDIYNDTGSTPSPTPINGSCGTTVNTCTAGTFSDVSDTSTDYLWSCLGTNGGTTASCSLPISSTDTSSPSTPINLTATAISSSGINLSWTASTDNVGVTGYRIYRGGVQIATTANTSYSDTGLSPSTTYSYTVTAYDAVGNVSDQSTTASATTQAISSGGTFYIRDGGISTTCIDWTNACDNLPVTLQRGATYYVADGDYGSYTFDDPVSGTQLITLKKATASDHGTGTGWNSAYGDNQAVWSGWGISTSYLLIDGQTGGGLRAWDSGLGIAVRNLASHLVSSFVPITNITFRHIEFDGTSTILADRDIVYFVSGASDVTMQYMYIHDVGCDMFQLRGNVSNFTLEYSKIARNNQGASCHGDVFEYDNGTALNWVHRYNWFDDTQGTYLWGSHESGTLSGAQVYGNIISGGQMDAGVISGLSGGGVITGLKFYNNTISNVAQAAGFNYLSRGINNLIYNNIWYNSTANMEGTHDYNWFYNSGSQSEAHIQNSSGNPFVNISADDYRLSVSTNAGTVLAGYDRDLLDNTRGTDGAWDRGAYEYVSGGGGGTPPPTYKAGDFNYDGLVNSIDLSLMITAWNTYNTTYDLNSDNYINSLDYAIMVQNWSL